MSDQRQATDNDNDNGFVLHGRRWSTDTIPEDGTTHTVLSMQVYRYKLYRPKSIEAQSGKRGRWQVANKHGGWSNCDKPDVLAWALGD